VEGPASPGPRRSGEACRLQCGPMRSVRCWCDELVAAEDDARLLEVLRDHVNEAHPDEQRTDDELRERIATEAEEPEEKPPWAY
jgi:hypothetical protein